MYRVQEPVWADVPEDETLHRYLIRVPSTLFREFSRYAKGCHRSVNQQILQCMEDCLQEAARRAPPPS